MLLLIITIICYYYAKHRSKQKDINALTIKKWKIMDLKILTLHNDIILIKPVLKKDKNHYYNQIFLEKSSSQLAKN